MEKGIAFFDFDGTITSKDTFLDFIIYSRGKIYFLFGIVYLFPFILLFFLKLYSNHKLKEKFFKFYLASITPIDLEKLGESYSLNKLPNIIFKDATKKIEWHKKNHHRVIILTASSPIWLSKWCETNEVELIGTQFEIVNGKYTGNIFGSNCYGYEKYLIAKKIITNDKSIKTFGYGDSKSDNYFLDLTTNKFYKCFTK